MVIVKKYCDFCGKEIGGSRELYDYTVLDVMRFESFGSISMNEHDLCFDCFRHISEFFYDNKKSKYKILQETEGL